MGRGRRRLRAPRAPLLADSREGKNPFEGYVPAVPSGLTLVAGTDEFSTYESAGAAAARTCAFILVAGGLGERLGFSGIKLALPSETLTSTCYLELYVKHILALEELSHSMGTRARVLLSAHARTRLSLSLLTVCSAFFAHTTATAGSERKRIQLVLMTSDDTDIPTRALLSAKSNFGLHSTQLHIIKQGKVPCLSDGDASLALDPSTDYY